MSSAIFEHPGRSSAWLERLLWEQEVARSNRVAPIFHKFLPFRDLRKPSEIQKCGLEMVFSLFYTFSVITATLVTSTEPPLTMAVVSPVNTFTATVPPLSPESPSGVVLAFTVLFDLICTASPASRSPPKLSTFAVLCRMALASAASTSSSSSSASSGTVVSVEETVEMASMVRSLIAFSVPSETMMLASEMQRAWFQPAVENVARSPIRLQVSGVPDFRVVAPPDAILPLR